MKTNQYYIQRFSNGDEFFSTIQGRFKNGNYSSSCVRKYSGSKAEKAKKHVINDVGLWKEVEDVPEDVKARFNIL